MEPNRMEFQKQCAFQSFCKRVLHNKACNAYEEIRRHRVKEVSFSDLSPLEEKQLYTPTTNIFRTRKKLNILRSRANGLQRS